MADAVTLWCDAVLGDALPSGDPLPSRVRSALLDLVACVAMSGDVGAPMSDPARLAVAAHRRDLDDVHWDSRTHPGGVVWPIVLALGRDPVVVGRASAIGYAAVASIGAALRSAPAGRWHATAVAGSIGGAVAAAVAAGVPELASTAAAHAASVAAGVGRTVAARSGTGLFHRSHAVTTAMAALDHAAQGHAATPGILEAPGGLAEALEAPDLRSPRAISAATIMDGVWVRSLPTSGFTHTASEAARSLGPVDPATVAGVYVSASPIVTRTAGRAQHGSEAGDWWSLRSAVMDGLFGAAINPRPAVDLTVREVDGLGDLGARIEVAYMDGRSEVAERTIPLGQPPRRLPDDVIARKATVFAGVEASTVQLAVDELLEGRLDGGPLVR